MVRKPIWDSNDFGCQLLSNSNGRGCQTISDSNDLVAQRFQIQAIWLSFDLRFK